MLKAQYASTGWVGGFLEKQSEQAPPPSYYKPGAAGKQAVENREAEVPGEYRRTADKVGLVTRRVAEYRKVLPLCMEKGHIKYIFRINRP